MGTYSVAEAKNGLPRLIDLVLAGEKVVISRRGKSVAELRPVGAVPHGASPTSYAWLRDRRQARKSVGLTSMELLDRLYEEPEA
jgi:antitoxin (DNA-binding transcriptional repressor) of toxin-antitoxin stability system